MLTKCPQDGAIIDCTPDVKGGVSGICDDCQNPYRFWNCPRCKKPLVAEHSSNQGLCSDCAQAQRLRRIERAIEQSKQIEKLETLREIGQVRDINALTEKIASLKANPFANPRLKRVLMQQREQLEKALFGV